MTKNEKIGMFRGMGASSHSKYKREINDFYSTDPSAIDFLVKYNLLDLDSPYWECACGNGALSQQLISHGYDVTSSDLFDRGYGHVGIDFLECNKKWRGNIITNPPFTLLNKFILKGLELTDYKLYIFAKIQTLETQTRYEQIFKHNPPVLVCPFVKRINCYRNGDTSLKGSAVCYAWYVWDNQDKTNETKVLWLK